MDRGRVCRKTSVLDRFCPPDSPIPIIGIQADLRLVRSRLPNLTGVSELEGKRKPEGAAFTGLTLNPNIATVGFDHLLTEVKS